MPRNHDGFLKPDALKTAGLRDQFAIQKGEDLHTVEILWDMRQGGYVCQHTIVQPASRELHTWQVGDNLNRARTEGVHASVMASDGADAFYLRYGFDECVGNCCEGEGNPLGLAGVRGGDVLFMWAKPLQGNLPS